MVELESFLVVIVGISSLVGFIASFMAIFMNKSLSKKIYSWVKHQKYYNLMLIRIILYVLGIAFLLFAINSSISVIEFVYLI